MALEDSVAGIKVKAAAVKSACIVLLGGFVGWMFLALMGLGQATQRSQDMPRTPVSYVEPFVEPASRTAELSKFSAQQWTV